jgi:hypothetical protein
MTRIRSASMVSCSLSFLFLRARTHRGFPRFFVVSAPVRDLLLRAKHLFVAPARERCASTWRPGPGSRHHAARAAEGCAAPARARPGAAIEFRQIEDQQPGRLAHPPSKFGLWPPPRRRQHPRRARHHPHAPRLRGRQRNFLRTRRRFLATIRATRNMGAMMVNGDRS